MTGRVWLDIEGSQYWTGDYTSNKNFYKSLVDSCSTYGVRCGVYSSASQVTRTLHNLTPKLQPSGRQFLDLLLTAMGQTCLCGMRTMITTQGKTRLHLAPGPVTT
jgi:hypothetical protein